MKNCRLLIVFLLLLSTMGYAQHLPTKVQVKGQITDSLTNETIPYATIRITDNSTPPILVKAAAADDNGKFNITMDKEGEYLLSVQYVGKIVASVPITIDDKKVIDMGKIAISAESNSLSEVVVSADKPLVKVDLDKITYSMEDDPESKTNNVLQMLKKVPMVTVDGEENVQLKGSSNYKIYLNGKPSNMISKNPKDVLKSMPANTIKDIEVITDPGAKYDAEGVTGIINIVTQKNTSMNGYTASLNASADSYGGYRGGGYLMMKSGKIGFTGNYNYGKYKSPEGTFSSFRNDYTATTANANKFLTQNGAQKYDGDNQYGNGELSIEIDTLNLINIGFNRWGGNSDSRSNLLQTMQNMDMATAYEYRTNMKSKGDYGSTEMNMDYQRTFSVKDRLLTASYRYGYNPNNSESGSDYDLITGVLPPSAVTNRQYSDAKMDEHTFQIDYTTPISKIHTIETGVKYILRINQSKSGYEFLNASNEWESKSDPMYEFKHDQDILAAYGGYNLKLNKWAFKAGLRYEATWLDAQYPLNEAGNFKTNYSNVVPSATATYRIKPAQNLRLGYNMRISRPSIWQLNPYENTSNPSYTSKGNPELDAVKWNSFNLNYNFFNPKLNFNLNTSYSFANNSIESITLLTNGKSVTTYENVGVSRNWYTGGYFNWSVTPKLRIYSNVSLTYIHIEAPDYANGKTLSNHGFNYGFSSGIQYTMPWKISIDAGGGYYSPYIGLMGKGISFDYHNLSLRRPFIQDKLNVSVFVSSPFKKENSFKTKQDVPDIYYFESENKFQRRQVGISISFRFGELKAQVKKVQRGITNDDSMGNSQGSGQGATSSGGGQ